MSSATPIALAHAAPDLEPDQWHRLSDHLEATGRRASQHAAPFEAQSLAALAGRWHDIGKYAPDWQDFLRNAASPQEAHVEERRSKTKRKRGPDHSSAGAVHAQRLRGQLRDATIPLQLAIAGHHAGLADWQDLQERLSQRVPRYELARPEVPPSLLQLPSGLTLPAYLQSGGNRTQLRRDLEMFVRMFFSALVDADFLDTEAFFSRSVERTPPHDLRPPSQLPEPGAQPDPILAPSAHAPTLRNVWPPLEAYWPVLEETLTDMIRSADASPVNLWRRKVLEWCTTAANEARGAFTLTVPTGGGKTLSSLAFALCHARKYGLQRVIIALPFTAILDQTAEVLRGIFAQLGPDILVEHHSALEPARATAANRLASENWDAPLILTTQVQLFESLFANTSGRCRKLHNLCNSVLILDEVQTLPSGLLQPILDQLRGLAAHYGTSLLLTTATQPALHSRTLGAEPFHGLTPKPREIVPDSECPRLFAALERVDVHWPEEGSVRDWPDLAKALAQCPQSLAIVHRRADAQTLWKALKTQVDTPPFHLSALMCPAHRKQVLKEIRRRLNKKEVCQLVSTQLVEAGVDLDFPVVYRAMAGLESLAQAAGRCNREGKLERGRFVVFNASSPPPVLLAEHCEVTQIMLRRDPSLSLTAPETFRAYFDRLYGNRALDQRGIQPLRQQLKFKTVAGAFKMIDEGSVTIVVPFDDIARRALDQLRYAGPSRAVFRALQPYGVSIYPNGLNQLRGSGAVELLHEAVWVLVADRQYHAELGLLVEPEPFDLLQV